MTDTIPKGSSSNPRCDSSPSSSSPLENRQAHHSAVLGEKVGHSTNFLAFQDCPCNTSLILLPQVLCVSVTLEKYFKHPNNSPSDYMACMRLARPAKPYEVNVLDYDFFKNYGAVATNLALLWHGKKSGDPVVTDIQALKYL
ncbi:hypothetical protein PR048_010855 [Dryococelus australis]|uniref:Uncharacterized protein n=1 Tax=Dryococelus australis TaxID=614101 RepID=A0ABQ9I527_9NEOP|nr:hypothetical protein PR048_010855 [Dryococelus australis]